MIKSFDSWYDNQYKKLEEEYQEYIKELDCTIITTDSFDEFCQNKYEEYTSTYEDMAYENYKDNR